MQTIYIDVYFLINFTVDLLSIYFALNFMHISSNIQRIVVASLVGALYAVFGVIFISKQTLMYPIALIILVFIVLISAKGIKAFRRLKFGLTFVLFQTMIGGTVYFAYTALNSFLSDLEVESEDKNRGFLILSMIVLLAIGVLKLVITVFSSAKSEKNCHLIINYKENSLEFDALVDSGNFAVDPMDKTPVMLISDKLADKIFGTDKRMFDFSKCILMEEKKKMRIIPLSFGGTKKILYGYKSDSVFVVGKKENERIKVVIALDQNNESYAGYEALIPLSALEDISYAIN